MLSTSNLNVPIGHRFKIQLTLTKKTLTAGDDANCRIIKIIK